MPAVNDFRTGGMAGAGFGGTPSLDWSTLFQGGGGGGAKTDPYPNMAMPGGLNAPMVTPQQQPLDYGSLFGRGVGGGAGTDPYPSMAMPGGLNAPMTLPQQPTVDPYPSMTMPGGLNAPMTVPEQPVSQPQAAVDPYPNMAMPGGLNAPMNFQQQQPVDFGSLFGQGVGGTQQPWPADSYNPANDRPSDPAMDRPLPGNPYTDPIPGGGLTAAELGEQAKARLAEIMRPAKEPSPDDIFAGDKPVPTEGRPAPLAERPAEAPTEPYDKLAEAIPLPRERPAAADESPATRAYPGADAPRPPENIPLSGPTLKGVNPRLVAAVQGGATFLPPGYHIELVSGKEPRAFGYHPGGSAIDVRIIGPDGAIPHKGEDDTGMYTLLARGVKTWTQQNDPATASQLGYGGAFGTRGGRPGEVPDLMHYDLGGSRGQMRPEVQFGNLKPLSEAERNAMPAYIPWLGANQVPLDAPNARTSGAASSVPLPAARPAEAPSSESQVNRGQDISPPPADIPDPRVSSGGFNALDAAANVPKGPSGVEKAQTFLNRSVESILQQHSPENLGKAGFVMDIKQPLREALKGPFGGAILSGLQPKLGSLGLTQSDFAKAVADPRARFGGGFGESGEFSGQLPSAGSFTPFPGFRASADFENRSGEQLGRDQLAELRARGTSYAPGPEVAPTPLGTALGLEDIGRAAAPPRFSDQVQGGAGAPAVLREMAADPAFGAGWSPYSNFRASENFEDRRGEQLTSDELAILKKLPFAYVPGPDTGTTSNPLSAALGLGDLPVPSGSAPTGVARPQGFTGDDARQAAGRTNLEAMFGGSEGQMAEYSNQIDTLAQGAEMPANTKFNLLGAAFDTKGKILDQVRGLIANRDWPAVDAAANSRLVGGGQLGIQFGGAGEQPAFHPDTGEGITPQGTEMRARLAELANAEQPSTFQAPASGRKSMTFGGGFSPSPEPRKGGVGPEVTLSPEHMRTMMEVESGGREKEVTGSYKGLYQLSDAEFRKYGGQPGMIFDPEENTLAAGRKMIAEGQRAQDILGRELTPVEQYMVHQQGLYGTLAHLANPDQLAWKSWQGASHSGDARAKEAIMGNLTDAQKATFGNDVNQLTSRDFVRLWDQLYADKAIAAGLPRPGQGGYFNSTP
jgi:hypothetical protein